MLTVYSDDHHLHDPKAEFIQGGMVPSFEMPKRADYVIGRLRETKLGEIIAPERQSRRILEQIHSADLLSFLEGAHGAWVEAYGEGDAMPNTWPARGMRQIMPDKIGAKVGYYCFDSSTSITAGTWRAALSATEVALTAAGHVSAGARSAFALCRPPGHHAGKDYYGGYCFLNNAAIAAQSFIDRGAARVAILDVDYHHGNGTQAIFYDRGDVYVGSLHVDPGAGWFPHYVGYAGERGSGEGDWANRNLPLAPGTGDEVWLQAVDVLCADVRAHGAEAVVVSLGVDAAAADPESPLRVSADGYRRAGEKIGALGPAVVIQEGGYDLDSLGQLVVAALAGIRTGRG